MIDLDEERRHLDKYREELDSISGANGLVKAYESLDSYYQKIEHIKHNYNAQGEVDYTLTDLLYMAEDTRISIASVIYYFSLGVTPVETDFKRTIIDRMFFYFVDDSYSRLYSCWNRIGNLLNVFFQKIPAGRNVYFHNVMDELKDDTALRLDSDQDFQSLRTYREGDYQNVADPRHKIIHGFTSYWKFFEHYIENHKDQKELEELDTERFKLLEFFTHAYHRLIQGIEEAVNVVGNKAT